MQNRYAENVLCAKSSFRKWIMCTTVASKQFEVKEHTENDAPHANWYYSERMMCKYVLEKTPHGQNRTDENASCVTSQHRKLLMCKIVPKKTLHVQDCAKENCEIHTIENSMCAKTVKENN